MSDLLSQEEIDALLKSGLADKQGGEEEEQSGQSAQPSSSSQKAKPHSFGELPGGGGFSSAQGAGSFPAQAGSGPGGKFHSPETRDKRVDEVNVQPAVFQPFDEMEEPAEATNLEIMLNLDLELRVELGKAKGTVRDILEMGSGSVLEINKLNGEPVDLVVNQKQFAKGEMIVIGENFGVRVTDILSVEEIIEALR